MDPELPNGQLLPTQFIQDDSSQAINQELQNHANYSEALDSTNAKTS